VHTMDNSLSCRIENWEAESMGSNVQWWRTVSGLLLFAFAFGYVEAAVVTYLNTIYMPLRAHFYPALPKTELFPLLSLDQLRASGAEYTTHLKTEVVREFATLLMMAGVALAATRNLRDWVAVFLVSFGTWDLSFYLFLNLLSNWPASLLDWDLLFLVPLPWVGPILAPVLVSISMIVAGLIVWWREYSGRAVQITRMHWASILFGGLIIVVAFVYDFRLVLQGGVVRNFHWALFSMGLAIGLIAFGTALRRRD
jgi:hypothetical protein